MRLRFHICALAVAALCAWIACSEEDPAAPTGDTDPPGLATVTGWDKNHVVILFDEEVRRETTDNPANYSIGNAHGPSVMLEDTLRESTIIAAALHADNRTVTLTTDALTSDNYSLILGDIADTHGNRMKKRTEWVFRGLDAPDETPPDVTYQIPQSGATGVSTGTAVVVGFTEPVRLLDVTRGLNVTGEGAQMVSIRSDDNVNFVCSLRLLQADTRYTVSLVGIRDRVGNAMPDQVWTFDTEKNSDTTPPRLVSTAPANLAVDVSQKAIIAFAFSEPMDPFSVRVRPPIDFDTKTWANGNRRLVFEGTWMANTQYTLQIRPAEMRDPNGNTGKLSTLIFSTGSALTTGGLSGTITGDANSADASNAGGGLMFAGPLSANDIYTSVVTEVASGGAYMMQHVRAKTYFPFYVMDSNHDSLYQPNFGDAVGIYGVNIWESDLPQPVDVHNTMISWINFIIRDPSAVYGLLAYHGPSGGTMYLGLFATDNFDPATSVPVVSALADAGGVWDFVINSLVTPIPPATYYLAAYLDANQSGAFESGVDPFGVYGGDSPMGVDLSHGHDAQVDFELDDPVATPPGSAVRWTVTRPSRLKPFLDAMDALN